MKAVCRIILLALASASLTCCLSGCSSKELDEDPIIRRQTLEPGTDSFIFNYSYLPDKDIEVFYHIPEGNISTMQILFALHGSDRNAAVQIRDWTNDANAAEVMVFAPCFTRADFPAEWAYQFGGITDGNFSLNMRDSTLWTVAVIEELFDYIRYSVVSERTKYDIWGHSAGSQFVHRFLYFQPHARVRRAVGSNAGVYMIPDLEGYGSSYQWPYSLLGLSAEVANEEYLKAYFARDFVVHLGTKDLKDIQLPKTAASMAQGNTRFERGHFFFDYCKEYATDHGYEFNWRLVEVPNAQHNSSDMILVRGTGAASILYNL